MGLSHQGLEGIIIPSFKSSCLSFRSVHAVPASESPQRRASASSRADAIRDPRRGASEPNLLFRLEIPMALGIVRTGVSASSRFSGIMVFSDHEIVIRTVQIR